MDTKPEMQAIVGAIARYFGAATDDEQHNLAIIRDDLQRYGAALVPMGLAYITHSLQELARGTVTDFLLDEAAGDAYIVEQGSTMASKVRSLVGGYGEMGVTVLLETLKFTDEDTVALAACTLANQRFVRPSSVPQLRAALQGSYGSACKLALALALYRHGDRQWFESLAPKFVMRGSDIGPQALEQAARSVFPVLALDIATNGLAYSGPGRMEWRRKQY